MPKRTNDFQQLVYLIQQQLRDREDAIVTQSKMLKDRNDGSKREVDIVVEFKVQGVPMILGFECTKGSRKPTRQWAEQLIKKHEHLTDKLVLVANRPLTAGAIDVSQRHGVENVEVAKASATDWKDFIDRWPNLIFAGFDFTLQSWRLDCEPGDGIPNEREPLLITTKDGKSTPLEQALTAMLRDHRLFGKPVMDQWFALPVQQRKDEIWITFNFAPPPTLPLWVKQGAHVYPLLTISGKASGRVGSAPLPLEQSRFQDTLVAHGKTKLDTGSLAGQTIQFVATEREGKTKASVTFSAGEGGATRSTPMVELEYNVSGKHQKESG